MTQDHIITIARLPQDAKTEFSFRPDAAMRAEIATELGLKKLSKLTLTGHIQASAALDWRLEARLGATVVQSCVVTLEPVSTRIDDDTVRHYVADWHDPEDPEVAMPDDDTIEPLGDQIDLRGLATEALALALPDFPKTPGVKFDGLDVTEPGAEALTDETSKPFASLAALKEKLEKDS